MTTPQAVRKAVLKDPSGQEHLLILMKLSRGDFRWQDTATGQEWDRVSYLDDGAAVKALRVFVESDPSMVGTDLTILTVEPPPERRAAKLIEKAVNEGLQVDEYIDRCEQIIARETNIGPMTSAFSDLLAYWFRHRAAFALALFPTTPAGQPRDLTMDGLLLTAVEAMAKSTGQNFDNLIKILKQPVQQISVVRGVPKGSKGVQ